MVVHLNLFFKSKHYSLLRLFIAIAIAIAKQKEEAIEKLVRTGRNPGTGTESAFHH